MARYRRKKALYEVMTKGKSGHDKAAEKLRPEDRVFDTVSDCNCTASGHYPVGVGRLQGR
jgi:hypothetical protein